VRGYAHESAGVLDKAIADYTCAVRIKPDFAEAFLARASAHESRGERGKAIADYTKVIRLKPDSVEAYFFRGNAYSENWGVHKGAFESTKTRLMKAGMQPDWPEAGWVRDRASELKAAFHKAISDYTAAIRLRPDFTPAYVFRGSLFAHNGEPDKAISDLTEAIRLNPNDPLTYLWRGDAYRDKGERQQAEKDYRRAEELGADVRGSRRRLNADADHKAWRSTAAGFAELLDAVKQIEDIGGGVNVARMYEIPFGAGILNPLDYPYIVHREDLIEGDTVRLVHFRPNAPTQSDKRLFKDDTGPGQWPAGRSVGDDDLRLLAKFPHLEIVCLRNCDLGDDGVKHLSGLPSLMDVELEGTRCSASISLSL